MLPSIEITEEVMFYDTDCGAVVHNMAYLRFIEKARTKLAALMGMELREMAKTQLYPVVVRTEIDYKRAAILGDELVIRGGLTHVGGAKFWVKFDIIRSSDQAHIVSSRQALALVQMPAGKVTRLPKEWLEKWPEAAVGAADN